MFVKEGSTDVDPDAAVYVYAEQTRRAGDVVAWDPSQTCEEDLEGLHGDDIELYAGSQRDAIAEARRALAQPQSQRSFQEDAARRVLDHFGAQNIAVGDRVRFVGAQSHSIDNGDYDIPLGTVATVEHIADEQWSFIVESGYELESWMKENLKREELPENMIDAWLTDEVLEIVTKGNETSSEATG